MREPMMLQAGRFRANVPMGAGEQTLKVYRNNSTVTRRDFSISSLENFTYTVYFTAMG